MRKSGRQHLSEQSAKQLGQMRFKLAFFFILIGAQGVRGQVVFEPSQNAVYTYLDEVAAAKMIHLNSFAKPYARDFIAIRLDSLSEMSDRLTKRQRDQLDFFLKDYGKELRVGKDWDRRRDLFYYSDSTFQITINPILGGSVMANQNGTRIHRRVGGSFIASAGKFGFYGSLRDNAVSEVLAAPQYITDRDGQNYKNISADNRSDYNEAIGGLSYQWKWGDIALLKDRFIWGNSQRSANIFSGRAPSYAAISYRLHPVKWLDFQYIHGWLISEELDSSRTYLTPVGNRRVYTNKNIAANYLTVKTNFAVDFTLGNSIIYSDNGFQPVYLIPFLFYKSADHTYSGTGSNELGQNAQFFIDLSARTIKNLHLYTSLFVDEVSLSNIFDADQQTNIISFKVGATWYNALPNLHLTGEVTRTNPWTYRHQIESTTFASNAYNLGHFLGENGDELFFRLSYHPWKMLSIKASGWQLRKGPAHEYAIINGNANVVGLNFLERVDWKQIGLEFRAEWELINDAVLFTGVTYLDNSGNTDYMPDYLAGQTTTVEAGFRIAW